MRGGASGASGASATAGVTPRIARGRAGLGFVETKTGAIALLTLSVTAIGCGAGGMIVNPLDISGPLAGIVMGLANTSGSVAGIVAPLIAGAIVGSNDSDPARWHIVFFVSAGVSLLGFLVFQLASSGARQF